MNSERQLWNWWEMMARHTAYRELIERLSGRFGFDSDLVEALIIVESSGNADAFRYEHGFYRRYLQGKEAEKQEYFKHTNIARRISSSYGLMQMMYARAVESGFNDEPEYLFVPRINLWWGLTILSEIRRDCEMFPGEKFRQKVILARWNGGKGGNPDEKGNIRNAVYAEKVLANMEELKEI